MKKIFSLILLVLFSGLCVTAQTTSPRFGIPPSGDNTGRALTYKLVTPVDKAGFDSLRLYLNAWQTLVRPAAAMTDSMHVFFPSVANCHAGDEVTFLISAPAGGSKFIRFMGANVVVGSGGNSLTAAASKVATITLVFTGTSWLEKSRLVQP